MKPLVTISAAYGTGGSLVGPRLADRLGVPFLDRVESMMRS
jgi:Cytidylate kinase-like family